MNSNNGASWDSLWNYQLWSTLAATKNAYYLYYHAKESLKMNGIRNECVTTPRKTKHVQLSQMQAAIEENVVAAQATTETQLVQMQATLAENLEKVAAAQAQEAAHFNELFGFTDCPECSRQFSMDGDGGRRPVQDRCCNHVKCRHCLIARLVCVQCQKRGGACNQPPNGSSPNSPSANGRQSLSTTAYGPTPCPSLTPPTFPSTISRSAAAKLGLGVSLINGFQAEGPLTIMQKREFKGKQGPSGPFAGPPISIGGAFAGPPAPMGGALNEQAQLTKISLAELSQPLPVLRPLLENLARKSLPAQTEIQNEAQGQKPKLSSLLIQKFSDSRQVAEYGVTITPTEFTRVPNSDVPLKKRHSPPKVSFAATSFPAAEIHVRRTPPSAALGAPPSNAESTGSLEVENDNSTAADKLKKKRSPVPIFKHITTLAGEPPLYRCEICKKKFKTKAHIKYHEFCENGEKPFRCPICDQGFIAKSHFEYHTRTHTGERPYKCEKCGKGFNQRGKVTRHMRSHTGEKPFICTVCSRGFANTQALRAHMLIHTGDRPYACEHCDKKFTGATNLKKHIITHTGERPYTCNHCQKSFGLKWTLDLHLRTHSSERPHACRLCPRAFSNSKDLRRHMVIHSGERPFKCSYCPTAFRRKDNLDRHKRNTHAVLEAAANKSAEPAPASNCTESSKTIETNASERTQTVENRPVPKQASNTLKTARNIIKRGLKNLRKQKTSMTLRMRHTALPAATTTVADIKEDPFSPQKFVLFAPKDASEAGPSTETCVKLEESEFFAENPETSAEAALDFFEVPKIEPDAEMTREARILEGDMILKEWDREMKLDFEEEVEAPSAEMPNADFCGFEGSRAKSTLQNQVHLENRLFSTLTTSNISEKTHVTKCNNVSNDTMSELRIEKVWPSLSVVLSTNIDQNLDKNYTKVSTREDICTPEKYCFSKNNICAEAPLLSNHSRSNQPPKIYCAATQPPNISNAAPTAHSFQNIPYFKGDYLSEFEQCHYQQISHNAPCASVCNTAALTENYMEHLSDKSCLTISPAQGGSDYSFSDLKAPEMPNKAKEDCLRKNGPNGVRMTFSSTDACQELNVTPGTFHLGPRKQYYLSRCKQTM